MPFTEPFEIEGKPWGKETRLARAPGYELKRLVYEAGHQGALQYHPTRDEAFHLYEGVAEVTWGAVDFTLYPDPHKSLQTQRMEGLQTQRMVAGMTFHVLPGMPHKFHAITRCVVFEASNGEAPMSVNCADTYADDDGQAR